jgi:hypothetical protein
MHEVPVPEFSPDYTRTDSLDELAPDSPRKHSCYPGVPTLGHGDMRFDSPPSGGTLSDDVFEEIEADARELYRAALHHVLHE